MATPATLNTWIDHLSSSILTTSITSSKQDRKRLQDTFRRRVKRHNFNRTNQFEVEERLNGLEEKFQILTLDNLSDALRLRRIELKHFENTWLPDVLDLFLHLSGDPARNENLLELYRVPPRIGTPPPLRWKDILEDDAIDTRDRLWRVPDFREADDSGYDDGDTSFSSPASQMSVKHKDTIVRQETGVSSSHPLYALQDESAKAETQTVGRLQLARPVTELQFIREALSFLRSLPSSIFPKKRNSYQLDSRIGVHGVPSASVSVLAKQLIGLRVHLDTVQEWLNAESEYLYIAAIKNTAEVFMKVYWSSIDSMQQEMLDPNTDTTVSLIRLFSNIEATSHDVTTIATYLEDVGDSDSIACLEGVHVPTIVVGGGLQSYLGPVRQWLETGQLESVCTPFFIQSKTSETRLHRLWHDQFSLITSGTDRPPAFLRGTTSDILACGKTSSFLKELTKRVGRSLENNHAYETQEQFPFESRPLVPFGAAFENSWHDTVASTLQRQTANLKEILSIHCGFEETLGALGQVYLRQDSVLLDDLESKLFERIDRCIDGWNDRFQLRDMLEEAFMSVGARHTADAITIHSAYTSSRSMQSRRTSVKILNALSLEYILSWPLANIIDDDAMTAYRRVSLLLMQIRRAKHCTERNGYISTMTTPLPQGSTPSDQKYAQVLAFALLNFLNTLYDHLMTTTITPATQSMRRDMRAAGTVDGMIDAHKRYISRLESSCLAAPKLKVLRHSLIALLDLCVRFSDIVSNTATAKAVHDASSDHEASSFMSARSRNRASRASRADQSGSDSDSDTEDEAEHLDGYSSFIVLENDTSIINELRKIEVLFRRQMKFLVAGFKGVGRARGDSGGLEGLADRLGWGLGG